MARLLDGTEQQLLSEERTAARTALQDRVWPFGEVAASLHEVRLLKHGGQDLLRLSSSHFGPSRRLAHCIGRSGVGGRAEVVVSDADRRV
jgi:hypothetical protein